ncbi:LOW QUALITY PROTEIN: putative E3 ubiquitin-protein ligase RF298 [Miscanthus floridulus]|uniref:LOW QUALITY PROTEIN: putative E3 ubiquitin-protein ligase RF298 n=1 Tax=Miscanthus floridulus TaxID=154761 RepID=UPI003458BCBA
MVATTLDLDEASIWNLKEATSHESRVVATSLDLNGASKGDLKEETSLETKAILMSMDLDKAVGWDLPSLKLKAMVVKWDLNGAACLVPKEAATSWDLGEATCQGLKASRMSWDLDKDAEWNLDEVPGLEPSSDLEEDAEWNLNEVPGLELSLDLDEDVKWNLDEVPGLEPSLDLDKDVEWNLDDLPSLEPSSDLEEDAEWNLNEVPGLEPSLDLDEDAEWNLDEVPGLEPSSDLDEDAEWNLGEVPGLEPSSDLDEDAEWNLNKVPGLEFEEMANHQEPTRQVSCPTVATPPPPSAAQEKAASRNKRKYRTEPPSAELGPFGLEYPLTADCVGFELMRPRRLPLAAAAAAAEGVSLDLLQNSCENCKDRHPTAEELLECQRYVNWSDPNETQLEEILLKSLDTTFDNAVSLITTMGYSEAAARAAVVRTAAQYNWRESLAGFGEAAVEVLKTEGDMLPREGASVEDMRKIEQAVLGSMVTLVNEAQPFYTIGDVMFCLLMSDMNVANACAMDYNTSSLPAVAAQVIAQPVAGNYEPGSGSNLSVSITNPQTGVTFHGKLTPVPPGSYGAVKADSSMAPASLNVSSSKPSVSGNTQCVIPNIEPKEHSEDQPFVAAATQSVKNDKPSPSKRGGSKRDSLHRQKLTSFDKGSRALGSKGSLRSGKHSSSASAVLERKCRSFSDSTTSNLKGSSRVAKGFAASISGSEVSVDLSFTGTLSPSPSFDAKVVSNSNPAPAASTDLSLSLPSSSDSLNHDSNTEGVDSSSKINFSYDEEQKVWIPHDKKDAIVLILVQRQKDLQAHMHDWTDWAQQKVMQVAHRLAKEKDELQSLRKEKEEADRLQEERHHLEESTRKKLLEMESAISRANAQLEKAEASARRREAENAQLMLQMEAAKRHAAESATNISDLLKKDENSRKRSQRWESDRALLQEDLAAQRSKLSRVQEQLQHAKELKDQVQARWKQEEAGKVEAIALVTSKRKEREQIETSMRSEENLLHLKAANDAQRYKSEIRALEQHIAQLKVSLDSSKVAAPKWGTDNKTYALHLSEGRKNSNAQILSNIAVPQDLDFDDIQRDRECVMCLSEEMSVVFLPCAHQVVCAKCSDLHEKQGMKECPSCRTPIQRRVCARPAGF